MHELIANGNKRHVQKLSVAVGTHSQHSSEGLAAVLDAAEALAITVVGDVLLDDYLHGGAARVARQAPLPAGPGPPARPVPRGAGQHTRHPATPGPPAP